jgi:hypothetical protein
MTVSVTGYFTEPSQYNADLTGVVNKPLMETLSGMDSDFYYFLPRIFHRITQNYITACSGKLKIHLIIFLFPCLSVPFRGELVFAPQPALPAP